MDTDIYIREKNGTREIRIPIIPDEIEFSSNGTRFASYSILGKGEVKIPTGANLHSYKWKSSLPGENSPLNQLRRESWVDPIQIQSWWSIWRNNDIPLRLLVTGTPINHDVYIKDYSVTYKGAFGDFEYSIEFTDARTISITTVPPAVQTNDEPEEVVERSETQSSTTSYTIKSGDTLWAIAHRFLGDGSRWKEIYNLNSEAIEADAKKYGRRSSNNGNWIWPGLTISIPT